MGTADPPRGPPPPARPLRALVIDGGPTRAEAQRLLEEAGFTVSERRRARAPAPFARESSSPPPRHPPRPLPQVEAVSRGTEALRLLGERLRGGEPGCDVILKTHDASGSANAVRFLRRLREVEALAAIPVGACPAGPPAPQLAWVCLPGLWRPPPASRGRPGGQAQLSPPDICSLLVAAAAARPAPAPPRRSPVAAWDRGRDPRPARRLGRPRPLPAVARHTLPRSCADSPRPSHAPPSARSGHLQRGQPRRRGQVSQQRCRRLLGAAAARERGARAVDAPLAPAGECKRCLPPAGWPACSACARTHAGCGLQLDCEQQHAAAAAMPAVRCRPALPASTATPSQHCAPPTAALQDPHKGSPAGDDTGSGSGNSTDAAAT